MKIEVYAPKYIIYISRKMEAWCFCVFFWGFDMRRILLFLVVAAALAAVGCKSHKHDEAVAIVESPGISSHNVTIRYKLAGADHVAASFCYSLDGTSWHPATRGWGGEGYGGLLSTPGGAEHTWCWDSLADMGKSLSLNVMFKVIPLGRGKGIEDRSPVFIVNNLINTRPTALILNALESSGNIILEYGVADADQDAVTAKLEFSVDAGANFFEATLAEKAGGELANRLESAFPTEANDQDDQLTGWFLEGLDLGDNTDGQGKIYVEMTDSAGERQVSLYCDQAMSTLVCEGTRLGDGIVTLDEEGGSGLSGRVDVAYSTGESDIELTCYKKHYMVWDSLADLGTNIHDVKLRIEVIDGEAVNSTPSYTPDVSLEYDISVDNTAGLFVDVSSQVPSFWSGSRDAVSGDFDGDGDVDIFIGNLAENFCYRNDAGVFSVLGRILHDDTREVVQADFNNDGLPDVFVANKGWNLICLSNGTQTLLSPVAIGLNEDSRGAACRDAQGNTVDFDNDGNPDIFVCNQFINTVYLNPRTASFSIRAAGVLKDDCRGAAIADFDGDGELDVFCCCRLQNRLLIGDGTGQFTVAAGALPVGWITSWRAAAFDLEGDGDYDIFVGNYGPNRILVNQGGAQGGTEGTFQYSDILPHFSNNTRSVAVFERGGATYLVSGNADGQSRLYRVCQARIFDITPVNLPVLPAFTYGVHVALPPDDFNNDGLADIYFANKGCNYLLLGN